MTVARFRTIIFIVVAIVSLAGLADATYLSVQALTGETLGCGGSPDCFRVLGSSYAKVAGMPVAMFGALAYFSVFTFATFAAFGYSRARIFLILTDWCDVPGYALVPLRSGLPAACLLPLLPVLCGNHVFACRSGDRSAAQARANCLIGLSISCLAHALALAHAP